METIQNTTTEKGFQALKAYWKHDLKSGFLVFLIALPLCLGIAKASGFPPAMGVLTAMVGGIFSSFFNVSALAIKGPAAGLITICAASVIEFGGGEQGWRVTCAVIAVMAILQVIFGILKFGKMSDFFPRSAVHGMLAAIGVIIIAKQIPVLLGDDPSIYKGEKPLELLMDIPRFIEFAHWHIALIGILGLVILFTLPLIKLKIFKVVPASLIVLLLAVPLALMMHFKQTEPAYSLVEIGDFWGSVGFNADFTPIGTFAFWKYVVMFLFVSTLESLLTVKAVDGLDPRKRTSSYDGDVIGQGVGNTISGFFGGLPMISEVVRSSANIGFGAVSKWSNFFHGLFLLLAMLIMIPVIEMIPNAALAAMLIFAGYRLAAPKEFIHMYKIGKEQLTIFLVTLVVTLLEDLLLGIAAGIIVKFIFHLINGASFTGLFKAKYHREDEDEKTTIYIKDAAVFSNLIAYKKVIKVLVEDKKLIVDFSEACLVDHSFISFLTNYRHELEAQGKSLEITGLDYHKKLSDHPLATRINRKKKK